jgi:hypothetical protein
MVMALASPAAAQDAAARYQALLADAKVGKPVDWQALRFAYADSPGFSVFGDGADAQRKQMNAAFQAGDFKSALAAAKQVSDIDFVDIGAHIVSDLSDQKLGDQDGAAREHQIAVGLLRSIRTGDGTTKSTAFTVIRVDEEYVLMSVMGMKVRRQSLIRGADGHSYDALDFVDDKGGEPTCYFQIDRVVAGEAAMLKH